jgi:uncharacterized protein YdcH (DUF465 family)
MSELEKQAKTVSQIMEEYNQLPDYVLQVEALEKQYVPFEFHQNKIGELENHFDDVIHDYNAVQKNLSEKVFTLETENKQLKDLIMKLRPNCGYREYNHDLNCCLKPLYTKCQSCEIGEQLRAVLKPSIANQNITKEPTK